MKNVCCFFDIETGGLELSHPVTQLAAIAVDSEWNELETFNRLIRFNEALAEAEALALNHYDRELWAREAKPEAVVVSEFAAFLGRHRSIELVSKRTGRPYAVARVGGHNIASFDLDRVAAMFRRHKAFFPIDFRSTLDTRYGAICVFEGRADQPKNFKLTGLAEHFGVSVEGAHDALVDVRLSIALARRLLERWQGSAA